MDRRLTYYGASTAVLAALLVAACGDVDSGRRSGLDSGGTGQGAATGFGGVAPTGSGANGGGGGVLNPMGGAGGGSGGSDCNQFVVEFEPKTPLVYILVDRSSSMFDMSFWDPLREAVLSVVQQTENDVIYGFASYTGVMGQTCPLELTPAPEIKLGNYADIAATYNGLVNPSMQSGQKGETPTSAAVDSVMTELSAFDADTPKFILLVTDGQPDFCDDPFLACSADALIGSLQSAFNQQVGTFVMAIAGTVPAEDLQQYANAGAGQPVGMPRQSGSVEQLGFDCGGPPQNGTPLGTYQTPVGTAPYFTPQANETELVEQLNNVVTSVAPCEYDLAGNIEVDTTRLDEAHVYLGTKENGVEVPLDEANGWSMATGTLLVFNGSSCQELRDHLRDTSSENSVTFDFPCDIIIVE